MLEHKFLVNRLVLCGYGFVGCGCFAAVDYLLGVQSFSVCHKGYGYSVQLVIHFKHKASVALYFAARKIALGFGVERVMLFGHFGGSYGRARRSRQILGLGCGKLVCSFDVFKIVLYFVRNVGFCSVAYFVLCVCRDCLFKVCHVAVFVYPFCGVAFFCRRGDCFYLFSVLDGLLFYKSSVFFQETNFIFAFLLICAGIVGRLARRKKSCARSSECQHQCQQHCQFLFHQIPPDYGLFKCYG